MEKRMYKIRHRGETVMIGGQPECFRFMMRLGGSRMTVGEFISSGWQMVPAKPLPLSTVILRDSRGCS